MSQGSPCLWTRLPQSSRSPCDRYKHACCSADGNVYILGGRDSGCLRDFWRYSVGKTHTHNSCWQAAGSVLSCWADRTSNCVLVIVCDEWTELSCSGDAAPEELEEHSMVAHEVHVFVFLSFHLSVKVALCQECLTALTFSGLPLRVWRHAGFCVHRADMSPLGVWHWWAFLWRRMQSTNTAGSWCHDFICICSGLTDETCCCTSLWGFTPPENNIQHSWAVCWPCLAFIGLKKGVSWSS